MLHLGEDCGQPGGPGCEALAPRHRDIPQRGGQGAETEGLPMPGVALRARGQTGTLRLLASHEWAQEAGASPSEDRGTETRAQHGATWSFRRPAGRGREQGHRTLYPGDTRSPVTLEKGESVFTGGGRNSGPRKGTGSLASMPPQRCAV